MQPEPVSPELVLVDPELARRERARLQEQDRLRAILDAAAVRRAVDIQPVLVEETARHTPYWREVASFSRRRLLPAALLCSLLANGVFAAEVVARQGRQDASAPVAARAVTVTDSASANPPASPPAAATTSPPQTQVAFTKASVERKVISLIIAAPAHKLPRRFVDTTTGLVKNNVQVRCRRAKKRSFTCAVRLASDAPRQGLFLRYVAGRKGKGVFKWYGYRPG